MKLRHLVHRHKQTLLDIKSYFSPKNYNNLGTKSCCSRETIAHVLGPGSSLDFMNIGNSESEILSNMKSLASICQTEEARNLIQVTQIMYIKGINEM